MERRHFIAASGLGALAGLASRTADAQVPSTGAPLSLTPQVTEGPFYLDVGLRRVDITEGMKGVPLEVRLRVVDPGGRALSGFRVDLWHCDAAGFYSGFDGQGADRAVTMRGRTFLRGTVAVDGDGIAAFRTVYPGWYAGRTTHLHLKVFNGDRVVLTSQLFLPDALSEYLYANLPAYRRTALRDTLNRRDGIALEAGSGAFGAVREDVDRYVVTATTVVDPDARPPAERRPGPPGSADRRGPRGQTEASNVRPGFQLGNQGGGLRGSVGVGASNRGGGPGRPSDRPAPGGDGPPPFMEGRDGPVVVLRGDERVAVVVPGGLSP